MSASVPTPPPPQAAPSSSVPRAHARVSALKRHRPAGDPDVARAEQELRAELLAERIRAEVDRAPALTAAQRDQLAALLRPTPRGGDAA